MGDGSLGVKGDRMGVGDGMGDRSWGMGVWELRDGGCELGDGSLRFGGWGMSE